MRRHYGLALLRAPRNDGDVVTATVLSRRGTRKYSSTHFVDLIFTSFSEPPFTNVFNATWRLSGFACLYRARNAD
jgi:hypothetical protein